MYMFTAKTKMTLENILKANIFNRFSFIWLFSSPEVAAKQVKIIMVPQPSISFGAIFVMLL